MTDEAKSTDDRLSQFMAEGDGLFAVHLIGPEDIAQWFAAAASGDMTALKFQIAIGRMALLARAGRGAYCVKCQTQRFTGNIHPHVFVFGAPEVPDPKNVMFGGICRGCAEHMSPREMAVAVQDYCTERWGDVRMLDVSPDTGHA